MKNKVSKFLLVMRAPCYPTGTESGCDIKTACMGIDIEDFSCKVESRNELTLQGFWINFFKADTTLGDKGFG